MFLLLSLVREEVVNMYITLNEAIGIFTLVIISIQAGFNLAKYIFEHRKK